MILVLKLLLAESWLLEHINILHKLFIFIFLHFSQFLHKLESAIFIGLFVHLYAFMAKMHGC